MEFCFSTEAYLPLSNIADLIFFLAWANEQTFPVSMKVFAWPFRSFPIEFTLYWQDDQRTQVSVSREMTIMRTYITAQCLHVVVSLWERHTPSWLWRNNIHTLRIAIGWKFNVAHAQRQFSNMLTVWFPVWLFISNLVYTQACFLVRTITWIPY